MSTKKTEPEKRKRPSPAAPKVAVPAAKRATKAAKARPKLRASHAPPTEKPARPTRAARPAKPAKKVGKPLPRAALESTEVGKKTILTGPKRAGAKRAAVVQGPEASDKARDLALMLAREGLEKKAIGIEILDVVGRVDYAEYLVIMTGRSDRHVHAIAMGLEAAMKNRKLAPLSMEGLSAASWVLIDFSDVVVHVFQEDARRLYDIEGLWIDANRVNLPEAARAAAEGLE